MIAGFIKGMIEKDDLTELTQCFTDANGVVDQVNSIVKTIAKGDEADIIAGIMEAVTLVQKLPDDLKNCTQGTSGDIQRIENWILNQNAEQIAENVINNFDTVTDDLNTIYDDFENQNYTAAGEEAADLVILALG